MQNIPISRCASLLCLLIAVCCCPGLASAAKPGNVPQTPSQAARQGEFVFPRGKTGNRGGRGFEQRVLRAMRDFTDHISLDPPHRPVSP